MTELGGTALSVLSSAGDTLAWRSQLIERVVADVQKTFAQISAGAFTMRSLHFRDETLSLYYRCLAPNAAQVRFWSPQGAPGAVGYALVLADAEVAPEWRGKGFLGALVSRLKTMEPHLTHIEFENVLNAQLVATLQRWGWTQRTLGLQADPGATPMGASWFSVL